MWYISINWARTCKVYVPSTWLISSALHRSLYACIKITMITLSEPPSINRFPRIFFFFRIYRLSYTRRPVTGLTNNWESLRNCVIKYCMVPVWLQNTSTIQILNSLKRAHCTAGWVKSRVARASRSTRLDLFFKLSITWKTIPHSKQYSPFLIYLTCLFCVCWYRKWKCNNFVKLKVP